MRARLARSCPGRRPGGPRPRGAFWSHPEPFEPPFPGAPPAPAHVGDNSEGPPGAGVHRHRGGDPTATAGTTAKRTVKVADPRNRFWVCLETSLGGMLEAILGSWVICKYRGPSEFLEPSWTIGRPPWPREGAGQTPPLSRGRRDFGRG